MLIATLVGCSAPAPEPDGEITELFINEFMAANETIIPNEDGDYVDWIELYNAADVPISLEDLYVTDDLDEPLAHPLPALTVPANGYLLLWADKELELGDYHLPFALEKNGESIGLSYIDDSGNPVLLDGVAFGVQEDDISLARIPDGGEWSEQAAPTPGQEN
jgi:hypothetical protein